MPEDYERGGLNDWDELGLSQENTSVINQKLLKFISQKQVNRAIHGVRVGLSVILLSPIKNRKIRAVASAGLAVSAAVMYPRHPYGTDGSDQASFQVHLTTGIARMSTKTTVQDSALWYLSAQAVMSYAFAGWVKLFGPQWRSGEATANIVRTHAYGHEGLWKFLSAHPRLSKLVTHGVVGFESLFPFVYLPVGAISRTFVGMALVFHVANGFFMGLGRFVWGFAAMHPAVLYTAKNRSYAQDRHDEILKWFAAALCIGIGGLQLNSCLRHLNITAGSALHGKALTRQGNQLFYRGRLQGSGVLVIFENALFSTTEHYAWITEELYQNTDFDFIVYDRAGYRASKISVAIEKNYSINTSVNDLLDLIQQVSRSRQKIFLVGHSLGGEIIRRVALQLGDNNLAGVVYIDSSHPEQFRRSPGQLKSAHQIQQSQSISCLLIKLGFGDLLGGLEWANQLPERFRHSARAQVRNSRMWKAGQRELGCVIKEFSADIPELPKINVPALVISASKTVKDEVELHLQQELGWAHQSDQNPEPRFVILEASHDSILTQPVHAAKTAENLIRFIKFCIAEPRRENKAECTSRKK